MVRRAEYALGKTIRKGQAEGTVNTQRDGGPRPPRKGDLFTDGIKVSPRDLVPPGKTAVETYALADAGEEKFEEALTEAKAEGNVSRANVVRHIRKASSEQDQQQQLILAAEFAAAAGALPP